MLEGVILSSHTAKRTAMITETRSNWTPMIDALRKALSGEVIVPGHPACGESRKVWNGLTNRHPAVIARCANAEGVATIEAEDGT